MKDKVEKEKIWCKKCSEPKTSKDDIKYIKLYGGCMKCILEKDIKHPYVRPTFKCVCGREYLTRSGIKKHIFIENNRRHEDEVKHDFASKLPVNLNNGSTNSN